MLDKNECRNYINAKKKYLNLSSICRELDIQQPHVSKFLKAHHYDDNLTVEKANRLVDFIERL